MCEGASRLALWSALLGAISLMGSCGDCRFDADCPSDTGLQRCDVETRRCEPLAPRVTEACESDADCSGGRRCLAQACHFAPTCLTFAVGTSLRYVAYCTGETGGVALATEDEGIAALSSDGCAVTIEAESGVFEAQALQLSPMVATEAAVVPARTENTSGVGACAEGLYAPGPGALLLEGCDFSVDSSAADGGIAASAMCHVAALRDGPSSSSAGAVPCLPGLVECDTTGAVCEPLLDDSGAEVMTSGVRIGVCR